MTRTRVTRRRVMQVAAALPLIGGRRAMAEGEPQTVVYVSNAGSKEVFVLAMDRATGALDLIDKTPVPGATNPRRRACR